MPGVLPLSPFPVFADSHQQEVQANATLTVSGSSIFLGYGDKEITLVVNVLAAPTGTTPTLQYTLQEVDPGDGATVFGQTVSTVSITAIGVYEITIRATQGGSLKVSWAVGGTTPSFTQVYATLVSKGTTAGTGVDASGVERPVLVDSSARQVVVGPGVAGTPAGGVLTVQGVVGGTAIPISGSISATNPSVGTNAAAAPTSSTQVGGSDGTDLQAARVFDADTGAGSQYVLGAVLRKSASGGSVEAGTPSDPLRVDPTGTTAQPVTDNGGSITVDTPQLPAALVGGRLDVVVGAALPAGTNNIGDVDVLSVPAPLSTTGGGTEAAALRVTVANDSTGVLSVDDNGGSLTVDGTVTANQGTAAATVGAWPIKVTDGTNTAAVKAASTAAVAADPALVVAISPNNPVTTTAAADVVPATQNITTRDLVSATAVGANGQSIITGAPTAGSAAAFTVSSLETVQVQVTGTWTGTLQVEISQDGGTAWYIRRIHQAGTDVINASFTANFAGGANVAGYTNIRVRAIAAMTGTATIRVVQSLNNNVIYVGNAQRITDNAGNYLPAMDAVARRGFVALTDGTNGPVAVKAPSTAAVAADSALVVAFSPNSPITVVSTPSNGVGGISTGDVVLTSAVISAVRRTTYTEQSANFTGSIVSASASDAAAGTGARTVKITYYSATGAGPFTETVTLNGVTAVNLVNLDHCYIEKMEVVTVGSTGSNVGIITLKTGAGGAGTTVGTIAATDNQTFWAHHYVPLGKTCYITATYVGSSSTAITAPSMFLIKKFAFTVANAPELQASDFISQGGTSSMTPRVYGTPIAIIGPARLLMYVISSSGNTITYRGAFDFYDL